MVELALHESIDSIAIEEVASPGGETTLRVHLGFENTSDDLSSALIEHGHGHACEEALGLFADDSMTRTYEPNKDFVLVRRSKR